MGFTTCVYLAALVFVAQPKSPRSAEAISGEERRQLPSIVNNFLRCGAALHCESSLSALHGIIGRRRIRGGGCCLSMPATTRRTQKSVESPASDRILSATQNRTARGGPADASLDESVAPPTPDFNVSLEQDFPPIELCRQFLSSAPTGRSTRTWAAALDSEEEEDEDEEEEAHQMVPGDDSSSSSLSAMDQAAAYAEDLIFSSQRRPRTTFEKVDLTKRLAAAAAVATARLRQAETRRAAAVTIRPAEIIAPQGATAPPRTAATASAHSKGCEDVHGVRPAGAGPAEGPRPAGAGPAEGSRPAGVGPAEGPRLARASVRWGSGGGADDDEGCELGHRKDVMRSVKSKDRSDRATVEQVLDRRTRMVLARLLKSGQLLAIHGCISTGKEANVYHGVAPRVAPAPHPALPPKPSLESAAASTALAATGARPRPAARAAAEAAAAAVVDAAAAHQAVVVADEAAAVEAAAAVAGSGTIEAGAAAAAAGSGTIEAGMGSDSPSDDILTSDASDPESVPHDELLSVSAAGGGRGSDHAAQAPRVGRFWSKPGAGSVSAEESVEVAIKVYKTSVLVFRDREHYVSGDYRFRHGYSKNPRKVQATKPPFCR